MPKSKIRVLPYRAELGRGRECKITDLFRGDHVVSRSPSWDKHPVQELEGWDLSGSRPVVLVVRGPGTTTLDKVVERYFDPEIDCSGKSYVELMKLLGGGAAFHPAQLDDMLAQTERGEGTRFDAFGRKNYVLLTDGSNVFWARCRRRSEWFYPQTCEFAHHGGWEIGIDSYLETTKDPKLVWGGERFFFLG